MLKVQFGSGDNRRPGFVNHDRETPIEKPLPYSNEAVDEILCEHTIEHVPFHMGMSFLRECNRILAPGGKLRVSFPSVERILANPSHAEAYCKTLGFPVKPDDTSAAIEQACKVILTGWGHVAGWTSVLMVGALRASGFHIAGEARVCLESESDYDQRAIQTFAGACETVVVEAFK